MGRFGEPDPDRKDPREKRPDDRHDLDDPGEDTDEEPVGQADRPETHREDNRDDHNENCLTAHERAQSKLDQRPGITDGLAFRPRQQRADEIHGAVTLDDPVRRSGEDEEHAEDHLERDSAVLERRIDET